MNDRISGVLHAPRLFLPVRDQDPPAPRPGWAWAGRLPGGALVHARRDYPNWAWEVEFPEPGRTELLSGDGMRLLADVCATAEVVGRLARDLPSGAIDDVLREALDRITRWDWEWLGSPLAPAGLAEDDRETAQARADLVGALIEGGLRERYRHVSGPDRAILFEGRRDVLAGRLADHAGRSTSRGAAQRRELLGAAYAHMVLSARPLLQQGPGRRLWDLVLNVLEGEDADEVAIVDEPAIVFLGRVPRPLWLLRLGWPPRRAGLVPARPWGTSRRLWQEARRVPPYGRAVRIVDRGLERSVPASEVGFKLTLSPGILAALDEAAGAPIEPGGPGGRRQEGGQGGSS